MYRWYAPWERVWGRSADELALVVLSPSDEGIWHPLAHHVSTACAPSPSHTPSSPVSLPRGADYPRSELSSEGESAPGVLVLRPALGRDHYLVDDVRRSDRAWLAQWEPTSPPQANSALPSLSAYRRQLDRSARRGESLSMVLEIDGRIAGLVHASGVGRGALYACSLGYWVTSWAAGHGVGAWGVAATIDLLIGELGLHRVEVNIRPENAPSLGLARKLGLREEGYKPRFLHINGKWADHVQFAIDSETLPEFGLVRSLLSGSDDF